MKKIKFMDCSFRDGFQSCIGARAKTEDFAPALEAAAKAGIEHIEIGGGARFQSLFFYTQENAFEEMDKWREIVGKDVFVSVIELDGKDVATTPFEIHKKYLDIHVDISGYELIETGDKGVETSFDENGDFGIVECENKVSSYMSPEDFYICMLDEPHKPACAAPGKEKAIKKCIFKVLV